MHTDVPEFRGVNRKNLPQWLLVVMHHSGLFDAWRLPIATGDLLLPRQRLAARSPTGPTAPTATPPGSRCAPTPRSCSTPTPSSTASTPSASGTEAPRLATGVHAGRRSRRPLDAVQPDGDGGGAGYRWDELRFSVVVEGLLLRRRADRDTWRSGPDDLTTDAIVDRLVADLAERGLVEPTVARDPDLGRLLIDTYVRFPVTA